MDNPIAKSGVSIWLGSSGVSETVITSSAGLPGG